MGRHLNIKQTNKNHLKLKKKKKVEKKKHPTVLQLCYKKIMW